MDCIIFLLKKHVEVKEQNFVLNKSGDEDLGDADEFKWNLAMLYNLSAGKAPVDDEDDDEENEEF